MRGAMLVAVGVCLGLLVGALIWPRGAQRPIRAGGATTPTRPEGPVAQVPHSPPRSAPSAGAEPKEAPHPPRELAAWLEEGERLEAIRKEKERIGQASPYDPTATEAWKQGFRPAFEADLPSERLEEVRAKLFVHKMAVTVLGPNGPIRQQTVELEYVLMFLPLLSLAGEVGHAGGPDDLTLSRPEPDGTHWIEKDDETDQDGVAHFKYLPPVQCRISVRISAKPRDGHVLSPYKVTAALAFPDSSPVIKADFPAADDK